MLGIDDIWVWGAYALCLLLAAGCILYGVLHWNRGADGPAKAEDVVWQEEQDRVAKHL